MFDRTDDAGAAGAGPTWERTRRPAAPADERGPELDEAAALAELVGCAVDARAAARALGASANGMWRTAHALLERQVVEHPARTLGVAAGIGFVVAGGLATPAARAALRIGSRAAMGLMVRELLRTVDGEVPAVDGDAGADHGDDAPQT